MVSGLLNHAAAVERAGGPARELSLCQFLSHSHLAMKQLLLLTHFTDEKGEVQSGEGPACGCGQWVV